MIDCIYADWYNIIIYLLGEIHKNEQRAQEYSMDRIVKKGDKKVKLVLLICNVVLVAVMLTATVFYSREINTNQKEAKTEDFIRTIESLKQVSTNYLNSERGYVQNWAHYISEEDMTLEEALDFLRNINTNSERFAHIIDMDTFEAYSSYYPEGEEEIDTYVRYKDSIVEYEKSFADTMEDIFNGTGDEFAVLGKYYLDETKTTGVGIGCKVTLKTDDGTKDYLMLRIVPTETIRKTWVFPVEYTSAEVGIITRDGDYVIQSPSMKSISFTEYIRGYNYQDNYNEVDDLINQLQTTDSGILNQKNFRGTNCIWYYSSFGEDSSLDILGMVDADELNPASDTWRIVLLVCGTLLLLIIIDGTYLIRMNYRLREAARISEQASKAKTQFMSAMSHDIRTPLNAVLGMMEIAQKNSENADYVRQCMHKGLHSGKQLLTLINDVLDISRIESGKLSLNPERLSLDELMHDLMEILEQDITKKGIILKRRYSDLPHRYILADRMRLNQIYMNILSNAVKYTDPGGEIELYVHEEDIPDKAESTRLVFYVKDTGIGMTEEFQKNMYNTFSREVKTQVNSTQGTGLGLAIVKQMVDLMDGTIECNSAPGKGTAFTVTIDFPIMEADKDIEANVAESESIAGMHLLVAEDNELNWEIINELLMEQGVTCDHAENGRVCVDMLMKAPIGTYAAVLMDVHMPVMDGREATELIRSMNDEELKSIPIIAMTADAFAEDVQKCLKCGMNDHIAKPIDIGRLVTCLGRIRNREL